MSDDVCKHIHLGAFRKKTGFVALKICKCTKTKKIYNNNCIRNFSVYFINKSLKVPTPAKIEGVCVVPFG
ncbi:MAG: hypothetical protein NTY97_09955, partial [Planctomycetota bacterium]|nr:hypothetical protein [Planctomycetota bacterium]